MNTTRTVIKNTVILLFGRVAALVISTIFTAMLARYVGPTGYGEYSFALSIVAVLMIFVNLGFDDLTVREVARRRDRASNYFANVVFVKILLICVVFLGFWGVVVIQDYPRETIWLVLLLGFNAIWDSVADTAGAVFFAFDRMEYFVIAKLVRAIVNLVLGIGAIWMGRNLTQIAAILILAGFFRFILSSILLSKKVFKSKAKVDVRFSITMVMAALPFALLAFSAVVFENVQVIMLGLLADDATVGWYASALKIFTMLMMAPDAFLRSIYPVLSRLHATSEESMASSYRRAFRWGLILQFPMAVGLALVADPVIALVFGPEFEPAAHALKLLSFVVGVSFTNFTCGATMNALGKEKFFALTSWLELPLVIAINWLLIPKLGYVGPAVTYAVSSGLGFIIYSTLCHRWLKLSLPWRSGLKAVLATLLMAICVHYALRSSINLFIVAFIVGPVVYGAALFLLGILSLKDVLLFRRALKLS